MRLHIIATALATVTALSIATPAPAGTVPIDYTISASVHGMSGTIGTMTLDYNGSLYSLQSLILTDPKTGVSYDESSLTLAPVSGTNDYCLYSLAACGIVTEKDSFYVIFDPSLTLQTVTGYEYDFPKSEITEASLTIQQVAAVPEPATWALMLMGFGAIGASMRWRRRRPVPAAA
jgi:hypothetical protein